MSLHLLKGAFLKTEKQLQDLPYNILQDYQKIINATNRLLYYHAQHPLKLMQLSQYDLKLTNKYSVSIYLEQL